MEKMEYSEFLETCMKDGYTGTAEELQEAYNTYLNTPENKEMTYTDVLEFFVQEGVNLNKNQISALQEKSSAWNRYVDSRAKEANKHEKKAGVYSSVGAKDAAERERDKYEKADSIGGDDSRGFTANGYRDTRKYASGDGRRGYRNTGDQQEIHRMRDAYKSKGEDKLAKKQPGELKAAYDKLKKIDKE